MVLPCIVVVVVASLVAAFLWATGTGTGARTPPTSSVVASTDIPLVPPAVAPLALLLSVVPMLVLVPLEMALALVVLRPTSDMLPFAWIATKVPPGCATYSTWHPFSSVPTVMEPS